MESLTTRRAEETSGAGPCAGSAPGAGAGRAPGAGSAPGAGVGSAPGAGAGSAPGAGAGSAPGAGAGSAPGAGAGSAPGAGAGSAPGAGAGNAPGAGAGSAPGAGIATGAAATTVPAPPAGRRHTIQSLRRMKETGEPIVMVTAYDTPTARIVDRAGVDIILVGDSLGMVVLGYESTLHVTMEDMVRHTSAVRRARPRALLVADMPFLSYQVSPERAVENAGRLVREGGADAVKLEGGRAMLPAIEALIRASIPVMGHLGITPQSILRLGGYRVQGRGGPAAEELLADARAIVGAGVFLIVLEGIPQALGRRITETVPVPTIGIGAGPQTNGQVLVLHDLAGLSEGALPRFVKRYGEVGEALQAAVEHFAGEVRSGEYPAPAHCYD